jgi:hypothetical protein
MLAPQKNVGRYCTGYSENPECGKHLSVERNSLKRKRAERKTSAKKSPLERAGSCAKANIDNSASNWVDHDKSRNDSFNLFNIRVEGASMPLHNNAS